MSNPILDLQAADTLADQLRHRRRNLPEQQQVDAARAARAEWQRRREVLHRQLDELDASIARAESESHEIDLHRARLEKQMKTIIAPREAEALMHEIAILNERRSALDDAELGALEEQAQIEDDLTAHLGNQEALDEAVTPAEDAAAQATAQIDAELADITARHDELRAAVDVTLLARYDEARKHQMVVAAALNGHRCEGCHLDLSAHEIDAVRAATRERGIAECPHCARLLVM